MAGECHPFLLLMMTGRDASDPILSQPAGSNERDGMNGVGKQRRSGNMQKSPCTNLNTHRKTEAVMSLSEQFSKFSVSASLDHVEAEEVSV